MRSLLVLVLIVVLLAVFNPDEQDFKAFVRDHAGEMVGSRAGGGRLGDVLGSLGGGLAADAVMRVTRRDNYYIFSTYTVDLTRGAATAQEWKFLGIATQFIELKRPDALEQAR
jgi:hypothetical protein